MIYFPHISLPLKGGSSNMKAKCHRTLGDYLVRNYMHNHSRFHIRAFLIGCTEPDKNPMTYFKGSFRCQLLRGHDWESAQRYMQRIASRLEQRTKFRLMDYYTLGKLIHYIADAFTFAHNNSFCFNLRTHRDYERMLQEYFLSCFQDLLPETVTFSGSIMDLIRHHHDHYCQLESGVHNDSQFSIRVACAVIEQLLRISPLEKTPLPG